MTNREKLIGNLLGAIDAIEPNVPAQNKARFAEIRAQIEEDVNARDTYDLSTDLYVTTTSEKEVKELLMYYWKGTRYLRVTGGLVAKRG